MSTLVYQSHPPRAPAWIRRCTASARQWADRNGYAYRLLGDELFAGVPIEITMKALSRLPMTDMGRLLWAERLLSEYERVVWIDADVLVFDPERFVVDSDASFMVCREVLMKTGVGKPRAVVGRNPSVLVVRRGTPFLRRWLDEMRRHAAKAEGLGDADFGREMLRRLAKGERLAAIENVGHFNASVLKEIHGARGPVLGAMMKASGVPFAAANLCGHYPLPATVYTRIVDRLMDGAGAVVNDHLAAAGTPR
jgi:hypothetical protein